MTGALAVTALAAHPSGALSPLVIFALGVLVGVPALVVLLVLLVVTLSVFASRSTKRWTYHYGVALMIATPILALAYPAALLMSGHSEFLLDVLALDLPAIGIAGWTWSGAYRLAKRARGASTTADAGA